MACAFVHNERVCLELSDESQMTLYKAAKAGDVVNVEDMLAQSRAAEGRLWACTELDGKLWEERYPETAWPGDINLADPMAGDTALCVAAFQGHAEVVDRLLHEQGINVNASACCGETPLLVASSNGHAECVQLLLAAPGINPNCVLGGSFEHQSSLILAAMKGARLGWRENQSNSDFVTVVGLLAEVDGLDVNAQDGRGMTALMYACVEGYADTAAALLSSDRVDPNAATACGRSEYDGVGLGRSALHWAVYASSRVSADEEYKEKMAAVIALLRADSRVNQDAIDSNGLTAAQLEQKEDDVRIGGEDEE